MFSPDAGGVGAYRRDEGLVKGEGAMSEERWVIDEHLLIDERMVIVDTIGEGDPGDPTTFDAQRQRDVARKLGMPLSTVIAHWSAIDLTETTLVYTGEPYSPPEAVYHEQLNLVELALRKRGECLPQLPTILVFDEDVEGCHAINAGLALAVYLRTRVLPRLIGMQYYDVEHCWLMTNSIAFPAETGVGGSQEALIPLPMGVGPEMLLSDLLSAYLIRQKKRMTDMSVGPMGVTLLVALERYRQQRDIDAFARDLSLPADLVASYRSIHDRRRLSDQA